MYCKKRTTIPNTAKGDSGRIDEESAIRLRIGLGNDGVNCHPIHMLFQPTPLSRRPEPFSHPVWPFEVKWEGFRCLAYIEHGRCVFVSRKGNEFKFPQPTFSMGY